VARLGRLRFSLQAKLGLVALVLLALPWAGVAYVNEVERSLLEGQEQALLATRAPSRPRCTSGRCCSPARSRRTSKSGRSSPVCSVLVAHLGREPPAARARRAGTLKRPERAELETPWWQPLIGWLVQRPTEDFAERRPEDVLAGGDDVAAALQGTPATRTRRTQDDRAV